MRSRGFVRLPRLSRGQKIIRNLLAALLFLLLLWNVADRPVPLALALRWEAERYGLPAPEILYQSDWDQGNRREVILGWDGLAASGVFQRTWPCGLGELYGLDFQPAEEGLRLFGTNRPLVTPKGFDFYLWTDTPEAARVECRVRLRDTAHPGISAETGEAFYFEETYALEAEVNRHGVAALNIRRQSENSWEDAALWHFYGMISGREGAVYPTQAYFTAVFYDEAGNELETHARRFHTPGV